MNQLSSSPNLKTIPEPSLRRLPVYHHFLKSLLKNGFETVSSTGIAQGLSLNPIQVRKDLELTGIVGKPKVGYKTEELIHTLENFLGWDNETDAFLVGVGHLGEALLGYRGFRDVGINIVAAFDNDPGKLNQEIKGVRTFPMKKLPELGRRMRVKIGILTVPAEGAQEAANLLVESGIRAIWNFAPVKINVPGNVVVQHENLAASLAVLSKKLKIQD